LRKTAALTVLLALSGCVPPPPSEIPAALVDCPARATTKLHYDEHEKVARKETDTNGDGETDQTIFYTDQKPTRAEVDVDFDGKTDFILSYGDQGEVTSWESTNRARDALPDRVPDPELSRVLPYLQPPVTETCVTRPEVQTYIRRLQSKMFERWNLPADTEAGRIVRVSFSVDGEGELLGACVLEAGNDPEFGASAVRALFRSAPFRAMPEPSRCLAGRRLVGTFQTPVPR